MMIVFYFLLMLRVGRCTDDQIFETKTVGVGGDVRLTCTRRFSGSLFWIRIVSGDFPKILGKTYGFERDPRITTTQEPGTFVLHIKNARLSDTAVYYCVKTYQQHMTFLNGTDLRVEGPDPDITTAPPSDPVPPGDSVTLQCSVLSDSDSKTCPVEHSVFWLRVGSNDSHPSLIYAHGNSDECEKSLEARSPQKCVYSFSKNVSSSDAGTYYCAVATCGEILFGNGTKLDIEGLNIWDLQKANAVLILSCIALAISLIVIAFLIHTIKMKNCDCCNAAPASGHHQSQQRDEDSLTYSAPTFVKRKTGRAERRKVETAERETIYTDVRTWVID